MILVKNINLPIDETIDEGNALKKKICKKLKINEEEILNFRILKESIDARRKNNILFNYQVLIDSKNEDSILNKKIDDVVKHYESEKVKIQYGNEKMKTRPIVIGFGPAGILAAYNLAKHGYNPIVFEMGENVDDRQKSIDEFWKSGKLNTSSNVQFGEGGAGTFSDGKLTTRIKDERVEDVLNLFVTHGAPKEILYRNKPHVGTDILRDVVKNIREKIKSLGADIHFNSEMTDINIVNNKIKSIVVNGSEIECENLILCLGHSSRNTYEMLFDKGFMIETKSFAVGFRVEHKQSFIDESQYKNYKDHPKLRSSEYSLKTKTSQNRGVYSFCMCPGGVVVNASSEEERLVVNGMSYHARDKENANSALVIQVGNDDFKDFGSTPLNGMEFQRHYENLAFKLGGSNYYAPVQRISDFIKGEKSKSVKNVNPEILPGYVLEDLNKIFPKELNDGLKEAVMNFNNKIRGFCENDSIFTGIETRTSAPIRIIRNENYESINIKGVFPCGEGAGYAGGIMSAAVDGIKVSESLIKKYAPNS